MSTLAPSSRAVCVALLLLCGCAAAAATAEPAAGESASLKDLRASLGTPRALFERDAAPIPEPPAALSQVQYPGPLGTLHGYLSVPAPAAGRHPAIIWLTGGFPVAQLSENAWTRGTPGNDQSAMVFREHGVITLYPGLRGVNGHAGEQEGFLGEVDDVLAAAAFLRRRKEIDPQRIYLGGHSTGGTLALLVAESSQAFRAVFAFGPTDAIDRYGLPAFEGLPEQQIRVRSPGHFVADIRTPTWIIEGQLGNAEALYALRDQTANPRVSGCEIPLANHFAVLQPVSRALARMLAADRLPQGCAELTAAYRAENAPR